jgi:hypothetical protein
MCGEYTTGGLVNVAMTTQRWARSVVDVNLTYPLRRGAWYKVLSAGSEEVVLEVRHHAVVLPRSAVEIARTQPSLWSAVPLDWVEGGSYLVCPSCANRMHLLTRPARLTWDHCHGMYAVESSVPSDVTTSVAGRTGD